MLNYYGSATFALFARLASQPNGAAPVKNSSYWKRSLPCSGPYKSILACMLLLVASHCQAQSVGDMVSVITESVEVRVGNTTVAHVSRGMTFTVRKEHGDWVEIDAARPGYVQKQDVLPVKEAVDHFSQAIAGHREVPCNRLANNYMYRAHAWNAQRNFDRALDDYSKCMRLRQTPWWGDFNSRGDVWMTKGENDMAIADFSDALRLVEGASDRANAYSKRGHAFALKGDVNKALADYNSSIALNPQSSYVYYLRSYAFASKNEHELALADCNESLRLNPSYAEGYIARANVRLRQERFDECLTDYDEAIKRSVNNASIHNSRAWLLATCVDSRYRDGTRAIADATLACKLSDWKDSNHLDTLAAAYAEAGEFSEAVKWQSKALAANVGKNSDGFAIRLELYQGGKPYRDVPQAKRA